MKDYKNSKEVVYKMYDVNSLFDNTIKINPKRKSDDVTAKSKFLLINKTNSNTETAGDSALKKIHYNSSKAIPKQKKICIKYQDLVADSVKKEDSESHLELALMIKKGKIPHNKSKKKFQKCNNGSLIIKKTEKFKKSKSINKVILGSNDKENIIIKKIKKILCFY